MKRGKKLALMLLALVLLMGATFAATKLNPENAVEEEAPAVTVFSLDPDTVTELSWDYSEPVSFQKQGDSWVYTEDAAFPVDPAYLEDMLAALTEVTADKTIEAVEDWDQYTLEVPYCQVTVTAEGVTHTLKFGEESTMGGQRYFSTGDGNAYLVDSDYLAPFQYGLYDVLSLEAIPSMSNATGLEVVSSQQSYTITCQPDSGIAYTDDYTWFMEGKTLDTELTASLLSSIKTLSWVECVDYNAQDPAKYGLDAPAVTAALHYEETVSTATNETDADGNAVYETRTEEKTFALEIGSETGKYRYARIKGSNMVYTIDSAVADALLYTSYYELQPDEVLLMDWDAVTGLDVVLDGETYELRRDTKIVTDDEGNETRQTIWTLGGEEAAVDAVTDALDAMDSSGYATGLTPEREEELRIMIHREHESFPEVELVFYRYDSESCMTTLNGSATVFVPREDVVKLMEEVNALVLD